MNPFATTKDNNNSYINNNNNFGSSLNGTSSKVNFNPFSNNSNSTAPSAVFGNNNNSNNTFSTFGNNNNNSTKSPFETYNNNASNSFNPFDTSNKNNINSSSNVYNPFSNNSQNNFSVFGNNNNTPTFNHFNNNNNPFSTNNNTVNNANPFSSGNNNNSNQSKITNFFKSDKSDNSNNGSGNIINPFKTTSNNDNNNIFTTNNNIFTNNANNNSNSNNIFKTNSSSFNIFQNNNNNASQSTNIWSQNNNNLNNNFSFTFGANNNNSNISSQNTSTNIFNNSSNNNNFTNWSNPFSTNNNNNNNTITNNPFATGNNTNSNINSVFQNNNNTTFTSSNNSNNNNIFNTSFTNNKNNNTSTSSPFSNIFDNNNSSQNNPFFNNTNNNNNNNNNIFANNNNNNNIFANNNNNNNIFTNNNNNNIFANNNNNIFANSNNNNNIFANSQYQNNYNSPYFTYGYNPSSQYITPNPIYSSLYEYSQKFFNPEIDYESDKYFGLTKDEKLKKMVEEANKIKNDNSWKRSDYDYSINSINEDDDSYKNYIYNQYFETSNNDVNIYNTNYYINNDLLYNGMRAQFIRSNNERMKRKSSEHFQGNMENSIYSQNESTEDLYNRYIKNKKNSQLINDSSSIKPDLKMNNYHTIYKPRSQSQSLIPSQSQSIKSPSQNFKPNYLNSDSSNLISTSQVTNYSRKSSTLRQNKKPNYEIRILFPNSSDYLSYPYERDTLDIFFIRKKIIDLLTEKKIYYDSQNLVISIGDYIFDFSKQVQINLDDFVLEENPINNNKIINVKVFWNYNCKEFGKESLDINKNNVNNNINNIINNSDINNSDINSINLNLPSSNKKQSKTYLSNIEEVDENEDDSYKPKCNLYLTNPSIDDLQKMSQEELKHIKKLFIKLDDRVIIEFLEEIDLTYVNLDDIKLNDDNSLRFPNKGCSSIDKIKVMAKVSINGYDFDMSDQNRKEIAENYMKIRYNSNKYMVEDNVLIIHTYLKDIYNNDN